ncbi:MAG TPA: FAD-dependent oxidoreductase [Vicinamibacterales bacterium]|nr:FAD-dependent oxidoreductase [Vicinamibacterales bacterium]
MRKPVLRRGKTVWLQRDHRPQRYPRLRGQHQTDIAIIGGGMTGAMIAEAFARDGASVTLVEAARIANGSTAASTALLLQEPDYDLASLSRRYGRRAARRIWELSHEAARDFISTIRRCGIACELRERDSLYYTLDDQRARLLQRELRSRKAAGLSGEWIASAALFRITGIHGAGAIRTSGNAQLNPLDACRGLIRAAIARGARIHEHTAITRIVRRDAGVRLYSAAGTLDAARVVIATGYATRAFRPLAGRFKLRHTYVLATEPIHRLARRKLGLGGVMLWDTERPYHYVRWTADHRLMLGGEDRPVKQGAKRSDQFAQGTKELRDYFNGLYPALAGIRIDTAWEGLFAMTPDSLPYIGAHRRYPHHSFALGYGGNGMTFAALAARILVEQWHGVTSPDHDLFAFNRI